MDSNPNKKPICALGFDCAGMMLMPGINPKDCQNWETCRKSVGLPIDDPFYIHFQGQWIEINRLEAARLMLNQRGCPQSIERLGLNEQLDEIASKTEQLKQKLAEYDIYYIAPHECELHSYNVKRGLKVFEYWKLTAKKAIFEAIRKDKQEKTKVIHCSKWADPRCLVAEQGIYWRNRLLKTKTRLKEIIRLLDECLNPLDDRDE